MIEAILEPHPPSRLKTIQPRIADPPSIYAPTTFCEFLVWPQTQNDHRSANLSSIRDGMQFESIWPELPDLPRGLDAREFEMDSWINEDLLDDYGKDEWEPLSPSTILEIEKEIFPDG